MSCSVCTVFPTSRQEWMANLENGPAGPFMNRDLALKVAVVEAMRLRRSNRAARIVVRNEDGRVCAERCLCRAFGSWMAMDAPLAPEQMIEQPGIESAAR
jgi:hypothetical protein